MSLLPDQLKRYISLFFFYLRRDRAHLRSRLKAFLISFRTNKEIEFLGNNWKQDSNDLPIIIFINIPKWKRKYYTSSFSKYRVCFTGVNVRFIFLFTQVRSIIKQYKSTDNIRVYTWSYLPIFGIKLFLFLKRIPIIRFEDGFLRSTEPGARQTKPFSLITDSQNLYFSKSRNSDFKKNFRLLASNTEELNDSLKALKIFKAAKLTKYFDALEINFLNSKNHNNSRNLQRRRLEKKALVVMQVQEDMSIRYGSSYKSNKTFLHNVKKRFSAEYEITARLHPDQFKNLRHSNGITEMPDLNFEYGEENIISAFSQYDLIITNTSLSGFEALLHEKKVIALGNPFYSGYGLLENEKQDPEENALPSLFYHAYIKYPKYFHPFSSEEVTFFEIASFMIVEKYIASTEQFYNKDILKIFEENFPSIPNPMELVLQIERNESLNIEKFNFQLRDFPQIINILVKNFLYNELIYVVNKALNEIVELTYHNNIEFSYYIFKSLNHALRNSNGRKYNIIPKLEIYLDLIINQPFGEELIYEIINYLHNTNNQAILDRIINQVFELDINLNSTLPSKITSSLSKYPINNTKELDQKSSTLSSASKKLYSFLVSYQDEINLPDIYLYQAYSHFLGLEAYSGQRQIKIFIDYFLENQESEIENGETQVIFNESKFKSFRNRLLREERWNFVSKILNSVCGTCISNGFSSEAKYIANMLDPKSKFLKNYTLSKRSNDEAEARDHLDLLVKNTEFLSSTGGINFLRSSSLNEELFLKKIKAQLSGNIDNNKRLNIYQNYKKIEFLSQTEKLINSIPQPKYPKGFIVICSQYCYNTLASMAPVIFLLKKRGYIIVNLSEGLLNLEKTGIDFIDKFTDQLPQSHYHMDLNFDWEVNWQSKKVIAAGINFYQGFYERISTRVRDFSPDVNSIYINDMLKENIKRADVALKVMTDLYNELRLKRSMKVLLFSGNHHVTPFSVIRDFAYSKDDQQFSFFCFNVSYENYFSNLESKYAKTMCFFNMVKDRNRRAPFLPNREKFKQFVSQQIERKDLDSVLSSLINVNRANSSDISENKNYKLIEKQSKTKKIILILGKVPIDLAVPYDGGPIHNDMKHWLNDTISELKQFDDYFTVVKPHPHELKPEIALDLLSPLKSLIEEKNYHKNLLVLEPNDLNLGDLLKLIHIAVLYNGTSIPELISQKMPVVAASYFAKFDYPLDYLDRVSFNDKEEYLALLKSGDSLKPTNQESKEAILYLDYLKSNDLTYINEYTKRQLDNDKVGFPSWYPEKFQEYKEDFDEEMKRAANTIESEA